MGSFWLRSVEGVEEAVVNRGGWSAGRAADVGSGENWKPWLPSVAQEQHLRHRQRLGMGDGEQGLTDVHGVGVTCGSAVQP